MGKVVRREEAAKSGERFRCPFMWARRPRRTSLDAPTRALEAHPPRPTRSVRLALLVALIVVQVAWTAVLLYTAFRVIGTLRGLS